MVYAIAVQGDEVWFGTEGGGATLFDRAKKTWKAYHHQRGAPGKGRRGSASNGRTFFPTTMSPSFFPMRIGSGLEPTSTGSEVEGSPTIILRRPLRGRRSIRITVRPRRSSPWLWTGIPSGSDPKKVFPCWTRRTEAWKGFYLTSGWPLGKFRERPPAFSPNSSGSEPTAESADFTRPKRHGRPILRKRGLLRQRSNPW